MEKNEIDFEDVDRAKKLFTSIETLVKREVERGLEIKVTER